MTVFNLPLHVALRIYVIDLRKKISVIVVILAWFSNVLHVVAHNVTITNTRRTI